MTITAIKDFEIKLKYTQIVKKALMDYLWSFIYKPMFKIMTLDKPKAKNSLDVVSGALLKGDIYYAGNGFKAKTKFNNTLSLALEKMGAKWDGVLKIYKIERENIPDNIRSILAYNQNQNRIKINQINDFLSDIEINLDHIIDTMVFDSEVITILDDANKEVQKNVKKVSVIDFDLTDNQKEEIAKTYTENMKFYVKDWTKERIVDMRKKVQEIVLKGYRLDMVQNLLEVEYGIGARKAKFLAQNETSIMLASYKKAKYQGMGFNKFIWRTITDGKERQLHKDLNGTIWSFDNLPIIDERTGQRGLPGETYNCRCELVPFRDSSIFKPSNINSKDTYLEYISRRPKAKKS